MRSLPLVPALLVALPISLLWSAASAEERQVADRVTGCRIWDQYPDQRKSVRWTGACVDGFAQGPGQLEWYYDGRYDGRSEGSFDRGRMDGEARVRWADGRRFEGNFVQGLASGYGVHAWPDGRRYEGEWRDDRRTGFGTMHYPNGHRYVGRFVRNRPTGEGEFVAPSGVRYQARVDERGNVVAGTPLEDGGFGAPRQSAANPPPKSADRPADTDSLEDWLHDPAPGKHTR